ncbi:hypothetical protein Afil01_18190 [Actinorhabdospora filicis]|uniref:DUF3592 domain-containing protein n=1 Tax=Actinorhabdospora filicis TaxID=1785913 RepID=A0A9W6SJL9_9ACTN|nr:DUF3592 domain-containing protein [Actinorhabdospora filicis]GLZ77012.1 hypothetical protein Afil01_18190 [Actinorhabdospora filicis]
MTRDADPAETRRRRERRLFTGVALVLTIAPSALAFAARDLWYPAITFTIAAIGALALAWAAVRVPGALHRWRLPRRGITVTARILDKHSGRLTYVYRDDRDRDREYATGWTLASGTTLAVSYDPRDPSIAVAADGAGRWANLVPGLLGLAFGLGVYAFAVTIAIAAAFTD